MKEPIFRSSLSFFLFLLLDFQGLSFLPFNTTKIIKYLDFAKLFQGYFTKKQQKKAKKSSPYL